MKDHLKFNKMEDFVNFVNQGDDMTQANYNDLCFIPGSLLGQYYDTKYLLHETNLNLLVSQKRPNAFHIKITENNKCKTAF